MKNRRRLARRLAFLTLFELESRHGGLEEILAHRVDTLQEEADEPMDAPGRAFARQLIDGVVSQRASIDAEIAQVAPAFPVEQMATTDRVALELGVFELLHAASVPPRVAINEAVELAKTYGGESSGRFVNGVLGTIAGELAGSEAAGDPWASEGGKKTNMPEGNTRRNASNGAGFD